MPHRGLGDAAAAAAAVLTPHEKVDLAFGPREKRRLKHVEVLVARLDVCVKVTIKGVFTVG